MTPTVTIEVAKKSDVLRVPVAALRFRPTADMFSAFNQEMPQDFMGGRRGPGRATPAAAERPAPGLRRQRPASNARQAGAASPRRLRQAAGRAPAAGRVARARARDVTPRQAAVVSGRAAPG